MLKNTLVLIGLLFCFSLISAQPVSQTGTAQQPQLPPGDSSQQIADRIIASKKPVLVDFWATWCGPCRMLNPILKEIEEEYKGKVEFEKVNVDMHRAISAYFGVSAIPAVFVIKDKAVVNVLTGLRPKEEYADALNKALEPAPKVQVAAQPKKSSPGASVKPVSTGSKSTQSSKK